MLRSKCFHCNTQFYYRISVCTYKLIMFQFDNIALFVRYCFCNLYKFPCFSYRAIRVIRF